MKGDTVQHTKLKARQQGFSLVEVLLILLVVALLGVIGWLVWQKQSATTVASNKNTSSQSSNAKKYIVIQGWGVRVAYSGPYTLMYTTNINDPSTVGISNAQLVDLDGLCREGGVGTVQRLRPEEVPGPGSETVEQLATEHPGSYTKIGVYYYDIQRSQAACSTNPTAQALQVKLFDVINAASVEYIP